MEEEEEHSSNVSFVDMEDIERKAFCSGRCHWQIWRKHMILPAYCTRCPKSSLFVLVSVYNILDPNGCCYPTTVWPLFNSSSSMLSILNFSILLLELGSVLSLYSDFLLLFGHTGSHCIATNEGLLIWECGQRGSPGRYSLYGLWKKTFDVSHQRLWRKLNIFS